MSTEKKSYHFSNSSQNELATCDHRLQMIAYKSIEIVDFTVICGRRSKEQQDKLYAQGRELKNGVWLIQDPNLIKTNVQWPDSKHNETYPGEPSRAFDLAPYPINWTDMPRFYYLAGVIKTIARREGIKIRWGGDWDSDNDFNDQEFNDLVHFELLD